MRLAALDTKFLLAFAAGEQDVEETLDYLRNNNFQIIITKSVVEQLQDLIRHKSHDAHLFALYAFWMCPKEGIFEPSNSYVDNGTSCAHAEKIREQELIPDATRIEAEILVEASCHRCDLLITFSEALLNAPIVPLNLALIENDMDAVTVAIASPKMIAERLKQLQK
jgi:hypothetical protein